MPLLLDRPVAPAMHRVAGSGLLCGRQRVGDVEVEVWKVAPWDGQEVLRILAPPAGAVADWTPRSDPAAQVARELQGWREWSGRATPAVCADPLLESQLAFIRIQQSCDGGFIAGVRRYAYSDIRDMHGACRGLLAAAATAISNSSIFTC